MRQFKRLGGRRAFHRDSGGVLIMALMAVLLVAGLAASFMQFSAAINRRQMGAIDKKKAFYMAEAGLFEAFVGLRIGKTGNVGSPAAPAAFGDGLFWVDAIEMGDEVVQLESTGLVGSGRAVLSIVARRGRMSVASLGVFAAESIVLYPGTVIDGYDSRDGTYEEIAAADPEALTRGRLGSNGGVSISGTPLDPTIVRGDVTPGPGEVATISGEVDVTGSTAALAAALDLPPVTPPLLAEQAGIDHDGPTPLILGGHDRALPFLRAAFSSQVILEGPLTLTIGSLSIADGAEIFFDSTDGSIDLYITGSLTFAPMSSVSFSSDQTTGVSIQVQGETDAPIALGSDAPFYGVIYAPDSAITLGAGFELYGSIIGRSLTFTGPGRLHFDQLLAGQAIAATLPEYLSWRVVELEVAHAIGVSPYELLGINEGDSRRPSWAHADQTLDLVYVDRSGALVNFSDLESRFDWDDVAIVVSGQRDGEYFGVAGVVDSGSGVETAFGFGAGAVQPR